MTLAGSPGQIVLRMTLRSEMAWAPIPSPSGEPSAYEQDADPTSLFEKKHWLLAGGVDWFQLEISVEGGVNLVSLFADGF